ncbi:MAG: 2Fe-2S iron-sulfur cluster-binding protein [Ruminococcus sp.]|nr:2Fe-2S iron-sulfur cluster-binding protein [Ruminococcus sp.]
MKITVRIKRQNSFEAEAFYQTILRDCDAETNIATLLREINAEEVLDIDGDPVGEIAWECSCLQKKCGACAMRINGVPRLACDTKIGDLKSKTVTLEPLKKFPVVRDLIVDRSVLRENLIALHNWLESEATKSRKTVDLAYDASRCIQCGCCLEVCPNFTAGESFFGAAAFVPASRILSQLPNGKKNDLVQEYGKHIYNGCGKSLSCHDICPVGIDVEHKLSNSNSVAVWKRFLRSFKN